jgi:hypothetical protein
MEGLGLQFFLGGVFISNRMMVDINTVCDSTRDRTWIAGFRVLCTSHCTIEPQ